MNEFNYNTAKKFTERKENLYTELKKSDKINRFAKDNLREFISKNKNEIKEKMPDLDEKAKKIQSFIETLDPKNTQNILEVFEKGKESFSAFFTPITRNGKSTMELFQDNISIHTPVSYNDMGISQSIHQ